MLAMIMTAMVAMMVDVDVNVVVTIRQMTVQRPTTSQQPRTSMICQFPPEDAVHLGLAMPLGEAFSCRLSTTNLQREYLREYKVALNTNACQSHGRMNKNKGRLWRCRIPCPKCGSVISVSQKGIGKAISLDHLKEHMSKPICKRSKYIFQK